MKYIIPSAIDTRLIHIPLLLTLASLFSLSAPALANPEVGADYSGANTLIYVTGTVSTVPTVLRTATVVCPVAGFTVARADSQFKLRISDGSEVGYLNYGISRNSTSFPDTFHYAEGHSDGDFSEYTSGTISRSDSCRAGESVTYRFVAYRYSDLLEYTFAWSSRLEVVAYRDRY